MKDCKAINLQYLGDTTLKDKCINSTENCYFSNNTCKNANEFKRLINVNNAYKCRLEPAINNPNYGLLNCNFGSSDSQHLFKNISFEPECLENECNILSNQPNQSNKNVTFNKRSDALLYNKVFNKAILVPIDKVDNQSKLYFTDINDFKTTIPVNLNSNIIKSQTKGMLSISNKLYDDSKKNIMETNNLINRISHKIS
jgi:hypothetical protein